MDYQLLKGIIRKINMLEKELEKLYSVQEQDAHKEFLLKCRIADKKEEIDEIKKKIKKLEEELKNIIQNRPMEPRKYNDLYLTEKNNQRNYIKKVQDTLVVSTVISLIGIMISLIMSFPLTYLLIFLGSVTIAGFITFKKAYKRFKKQMFKVYDLQSNEYKNRQSYNLFMKKRPDLSKEEEISEAYALIGVLEEEIKKIASALEQFQIALQTRDARIYNCENELRQQESNFVSLLSDSDIAEILFNSKFTSDEQFTAANIITKAKNKAAAALMKTQKS